MRNVYKFFFSLIILAFASADLLKAQQEVMVRDLHTYDAPLSSQADLPGHPLVGEEVTFDAVIVSYPKNSGLASITSAGVPGRIHVFVTDVNAIAEGEDGMTIQIVVDGSQRETLEGLFRGDVISVTGELTFFGNVSQFNASDVELLGSIAESEFEDLAPLLEPTLIDLTELNQQSDQEGLHRWRAENYTQYINRYVKIEGLEVIDRLVADNGRPWFILSDGNTVLTSNDTSLRFRNDRVNYAYDPEDDEGLSYNYRRLSEELDGPFVPPAPGSIVDFSGFVVVNTFNPGGLDESAPQSTFKVAPWDDGVVWQNDGDNPADRLTPSDWPNDFQVVGFAPITQNLSISPDAPILSDDAVTVSLDVLLPEDDYTLESVEIQYMAYSYTEDSSDLVTVEMSASGDTYSYTFDEQDEFTNVEFEIVATAQTPEGVQTVARESGSFFIESNVQTSPVVFSPGAGTYVNQVTIELSTATEGATIYYTNDGSTPTDDSSVYTVPIGISSTQTISAIAVSDELDDSPENSRLYEIQVDVVEVGTMAALRDGLQDGTTYQYTGDAVVTYTRPANRNQIYLMDETGGILIDDPTGIITSTYQVGDVMTDIAGTLSVFSGLLQYTPALNPGDPESSVDVEPVSYTLDELNLEQHESMLVRIEDVMFVESGDFEGGSNYSLVDGSIDPESPVIFRTNFTESNYIGEPIPSGEINLVTLVGNFNGTMQLTSRSLADFEMPTSNEPGTNPHEFALAQNYPNPFNPTTQINYSLAERADVRLVVYDILGRQVATLVNDLQSAGLHTVNFDMSSFASGTYIYRLEAGDFVSVRKMMLIK